MGNAWPFSQVYQALTPNFYMYNLHKSYERAGNTLWPPFIVAEAQRGEMACPGMWDSSGECEVSMRPLDIEGRAQSGG